MVYAFFLLTALIVIPVSCCSSFSPSDFSLILSLVYLFHSLIPTKFHPSSVGTKDKCCVVVDKLEGALMSSFIAMLMHREINVSLS